jgi:hypothetical protein
VRFQFLDLDAPRGLIDATRGDTRSFVATQLDREDLFIAEMEKRGIYIDFNLLVGREFRKGDGVTDATLVREGANGVSLFDRRMIELQKEYAKKLLGHRNAYTGRRYTQDPGVALVEINNENALDIGFSAPSKFYRNELTELYNRWLRSHRTQEQRNELAAIASIGNARAQIPLLRSIADAAKAPPERFYTEAEFYEETQRAYFDEMQNYLKQQLGLRSLVIATSDYNHASSGYPIVMAALGSDVIDGHVYWQHPEEQYVRKSPMVNEPFNSTVVNLSRSAVAGKPYTVSEINYPFPNDYSGEGIPVIAAYGLFQDWDAVFLYTFEPKPDQSWKSYVGDPFDISLDPVKMPELAANAVVFLRGDIHQAESIDFRSYTARQVYASILLPVSERPFFMPGYGLDLPLEHEVRIESFDKPAKSPGAIHSAPDPIRSDTGELSWYHPIDQQGMVVVDTPRTEALIGFVRSHQVTTKNLKTELNNQFCVVQLTSLDGQPISRSSRLMLVTGGRVRNTGQTWNEVGTDVTNWGGAPTLIEPVSGSITFTNLVDDVRSVRVQPIDGAGQPFGNALQGERNNDGWKVKIGEVSTTWYEVKVDR